MAGVDWMGLFVLKSRIGTIRMSGEQPRHEEIPGIMGFYGREEM